MPKILIAHFSSRAIATLLIMLALLLAGSLILFKSTDQFTRIGPLAVYVMAAELFCATIFAALANRILLDSRTALWMEYGRLIYISRFYLNIDCGSIDHLSEVAGTSAKWPRIVVHLHDGSTRIIPTGGLVESAECVIVKLQSELDRWAHHS